MRKKPKNSGRFFFSTLSACFLLLFASECGAQSDFIDFRFSPEYWHSAIGFPGDNHKTLVNEKGALLYDFGPGPYVRPGTVISVGLTDEDLILEKQFYPDPRVPVIQTELANGKHRLTIKSYSIVPERFDGNPAYTGDLWRTNGLTGSLGWASPPDSADPAFRNVAWGTNRPIEYHLRVTKGQRKKIVLGFCESYRTKPGLRRLRLVVEGADARTIDPLQNRQVNEPQVYQFIGHDTNSDGVLDIEILSPVGDPNTIVNVIWIFPADFEVDEAALIRGELSAQAEQYIDGGREPQVLKRPPRFDVLDVEIPAGGSPRLEVLSKRNLKFNAGENVVYAGNIALIKMWPKPEKAEWHEHGLGLIFPRGTARAIILVQDGFDSNPDIFPQPEEARSTERLARYWLEDVEIPYDRIVVPDQRLQEMLAVSVRTLYQMTEYVDGHLQFQPGAALYRGLWIHDGVYFAELALQLGDYATAREAIETYLRHQHETGQVEVMRPINIHRETPLLIWMLCRYAELTGDDKWLNERWSRVEKGIDWIRYLREQSLQPGAPNYGLTPEGFADGGVGGVQPEYASVNWILIALPKAIETARRFGRKDQADSWENLYREFLSSFRAAALRDVRNDKNGNPYLPVRVGAKGSDDDIPQQGQWMLPEALIHGRHIDPKDPIVSGTIKMLESHERQGLVTSVGWLKDGIWVYYGGFLAEAYLKLGEGEKAGRILYAMANHASPMSSWPEEQMPVGEGRRTVGDNPHGWTSASMLRLSIRLLAMEDGDDLVLFRGLPTQWLEPGKITELKNIATRFGPVNLSLRISKDGMKAEVSLNSMKAVGNGEIILDTSAFRAVGFRLPEDMSLPNWSEPFEAVFSIK